MVVQKYVTSSLVPRALPVFNVTRFLHVTLKNGSGLGMRLCNKSSCFSQKAQTLTNSFCHIKTVWRHPKIFSENT